MDIVDPVWDYRVNICRNSQFMEEKHGGVKEFKCLGHKPNAK
jgi:hypothetical protein